MRIHYQPPSKRRDRAGEHPFEVARRADAGNSGDMSDRATLVLGALFVVIGPVGLAMAWSFVAAGSVPTPGRVAPVSEPTRPALCDADSWQLPAALGSSAPPRCGIAPRPEKGTTLPT